MKSFKLPEDKKSLLEPFSFELGGKTYTKDCIDYKFMKLLGDLEKDESKYEQLVIELIGRQNFEKNKPFSYLEITMLIKWISEEILNPFYKGEIEDVAEKNVPAK